jgi:hypothetical protein
MRRKKRTKEENEEGENRHNTTHTTEEHPLAYLEIKEFVDIVISVKDGLHHHKIHFFLLVGLHTV